MDEDRLHISLRERESPTGVERTIGRRIGHFPQNISKRRENSLAIRDRTQRSTPQIVDHLLELFMFAGVEAVDDPV